MGSEFQKSPLRIVFDIKKEDLRHKARHTVGGHEIGSSRVESFYSVVQSMITRMALTMAELRDSKLMGGDFGNAFPHASALEKAHAVVGEEFE